MNREYLLARHEDLSSDPLHPWKSWAKVVPTCLFPQPFRADNDSRNLLAASLAEASRLELSERPYL